MRFINCFLTQLTGPLLVGAAGLPIPPAALARLGPSQGGEYLLTITGSLDPMEQQAFEVVRVTFADGAAVLERGQQGTGDQPWPVDSFVYASVTAGHLEALLASVADLASRVTVLEQGGEAMPDNALVVDGQLLVDDQGNALIAQA
ncbi:hypothetical protein G5B91_07625 [Pseudomonas nitroreducens]|uniref:Uncharacterized protein n=1 Tax=Pseudomonas nitroreducens TaxID=46680 RepID=A0A6G6ISP9_PSENT|nr:hypothetical protein [Pseudomonas nitroreducens]QIE86138.1 hypothetical protein G5B91_07625 [Pseudomonas nitroreducens]